MATANTSKYETVKMVIGEVEVVMVTGHKPRYEVRRGTEVVHVEQASRAWRQEFKAAVAVAEARAAAEAAGRDEGVAAVVAIMAGGDPVEAVAKVRKARKSRSKKVAEPVA